MIAHISIGARDIARARRFYDAALKPLGYTCLSAGDDSLGYGAKAPEFWIIAHAASGAGGRQVRPAHLLHRTEPRGGRCLPQGGAEGRRQGQRQAGPARRITARTITPRSRSIRTAIGSRPGAASNA